MKTKNNEEYETEFQNMTTFTRRQNQGLKKLLNEKDEEINIGLCQLKKINDDIEDKNLVYQSLKRKWNVANEELRLVHENYKMDLDKMTMLEHEINILKEKSKQEIINKENTEAGLNTTEIDSKAILMKINDITVKYRKSIVQLNVDKDYFIIRNIKYKKKLIASELNVILKQAILRRLGYSVNKIKRAANRKILLDTKITNIIQIPEIIKERIIERRFNQWRFKVLRTRQDRLINLKLILRIVIKKRKASFFYKWIKPYKNLSSKIQYKLMSAKSIWKLNKKISLKKTRALFTKWLKICLTDNKMNFLLSRHVGKGDIIAKRKAMHIWLEKSKQNAKLKKLNNEMCDVIFKREMFNRFKYNIKLQQYAKILNMQQQIREKSTQKRITLWHNMFQVLFLKETERSTDFIKEKILYALNHNRLSNKLEKSRSQYEKYDINRKVLNRKANESQKLLNKSNERFKMRSIMIIFRRRLSYFFNKWRNLIISSSESAKIISTALLKLQKLKLRPCFDEWYTKIYRGKLDKGMHNQQVLARKIHELLDTNLKLDQGLERYAMNLYKSSMKKLKKTVKIIQRNLVKKRFYDWLSVAKRSQSFKNCLLKLEKIVRISLVRYRFNQYRVKVKFVNNKIRKGNKESIIKNLVSHNLLKKTILSLKAYRLKYKFLLKRLAKIMIRSTKKKALYFIKIWKKIADKYIEEIMTKEDRIRIITIINRSIEEEQRKIQDEKEDFEYTKRRGKKSAATTFIKTLVMKHFMNMRAAFRGFRSFAHRSKLFTILIPKLTKRQYKRSLRNALYEWKSKIYNKNKSKISARMNRMIEDHNDDIQKNTKKIDANELSRLELVESIKQYKAKEQLNRLKVNKIAKIMFNFKKLHKCESLSGHFLSLWIDSYRRKKSIANQVKEISIKYIKKSVYYILKVSALKKVNKKNKSLSLKRITSNKKRMVMKPFFSKWRCYTMEIRKLTLFELVKREDKKIMDRVNALSRIVWNAHSLYETSITRKRRHRILSAFMKQLKYMKVMKGCSMKLRKRLRFNGLLKSFGKWHEEITEIDKDLQNERKATNHYGKKLKKQIIKSWSRLNNVINKLPKLLGNIANRKALNLLCKIIETVKGYKDYKTNETNSNFVNGTTKMYYGLLKMHKIRISEAFASIKYQGYAKRLDKELLSRIMVKALCRKCRFALKRWLLRAERKSVVSETEFAGKSAQRVVFMMRISAIIKNEINSCNFENKLEFNRKQKLIAKDQENISSKENEEESVGANFIRRWSMLYRRSNIKELYIRYWRKWIEKRHNMMKCSTFILNRLKNPEIDFFWNRLIHIKRSAKKRSDNMYRDQLIHQIVYDENFIKYATISKSNAEKQIKQYKGLNMLFTTTYNHGRKLTMGVIINIWRRKYLKYFSKWRTVVQNMQIQEISKVIAERQNDLKKLMDASIRLKEKRKAIIAEHVELRKTSMDAIEISYAIQEISCEREQMSTDLANRSLTLKRLIEENQILKLKIRQIQRNCDQIYRFTFNK